MPHKTIRIDGTDEEKAEGLVKLLLDLFRMFKMPMDGQVVSTTLWFMLEKVYHDAIHQHPSGKDRKTIFEAIDRAYKRMLDGLEESV